MKVQCVWEHNGNDTLLYARDHTGAFTRGASLEEAISKMPGEILFYLHWTGENVTEDIVPVIAEEYKSSLDICDADSDVIFSTEKQPLIREEYLKLKALALKSAMDFQLMYDSIADKNSSCIEPRKSFLGQRPRTAYEMYEHTKCVNPYYFGEIGVMTTSDGSILECRLDGFSELEKSRDYLSNKVFLGSYNEEWSLKKVLRRFVWHDRIHAKAMYRMAVKTFGEGSVNNTFGF